jgi:hypothetical protein
VSDCGGDLKDLVRKECVTIGQCSSEGRVEYEGECICKSGETLQEDGFTCAKDCKYPHVRDYKSYKCVTQP